MTTDHKKISAALAAFAVIAITIAGLLDGEPAPTEPDTTPSTATECECECATPAPTPDLTTEPLPAPGRPDGTR